MAAAPKNFRQPTSLTDLEITCGEVKLYFERSLLARVQPKFLAQMTAPEYLGQYWRLTSQEKPEVLEAFLRVLDDYVMSCGLNGPNYEEVDREGLRIPLTKAEKILFVDFCLRQSIPQLVQAFFWTDRRSLGETLALYELVSKHGDCLDDKEEELKTLLAKMEYFLSWTDLPADSKLPLWVFQRIWADSGLEEFDATKNYHPWGDTTTTCQRKEKFLENVKRAGYTEAEVRQAPEP